MLALDNWKLIKLLLTENVTKRAKKFLKNVLSYAHDTCTSFSRFPQIPEIANRLYLETPKIE